MTLTSYVKAKELLDLLRRPRRRASLICLVVGGAFRRLDSPCPYQEESRNPRHTSRGHRVGPPPVVSLSLTGLGDARLPAMIGQQRLRIVGAEAPHDTAPGEGSQQRPHHRGGQQFSVHEVHPEVATFTRQRAYVLKKAMNSSWRQVEEQPLYKPYGRFLRLIAGIAHRQMTQAVGVFRQVAWYHKRHPTFADALALVRKELWVSATFYGSPAQSDTVKVPRAYVERLTDAVCYAA